MAELIYSMITSLDGYIADDSGGFSWAMPDEAMHTFLNELERPVDIYLYGRRMYEVMVAWETLGGDGDEPPFIREYGKIWRAASKVVYSSTLERVSGARTRLEREFDPAAIRLMKSESVGDISIGGAGIAAQAITEGLVDEYRFLVVPVIVGGGTRSLPRGVRLDLALVDERRFASGAVYLAYRPAD